MTSDILSQKQWKQEILCKTECIYLYTRSMTTQYYCGFDHIVEVAGYRKHKTHRYVVTLGFAINSQCGFTLNKIIFIKTTFSQ